MSIALMLLLPLLIGWLVRDRLTAFVTYLAAFSVVFTFQSTMLVIKWVGGSKSAFGGFPKADTGDVWSYGVVNLVFLAVGTGLLTGTGVLAARRRAKHVGPVAERVAA